jgi:heme A synthase
MNSIISSLVVILGFAVIGWLLIRGSKPPTKWWAWVLILLATIVAGTIGISTVVVGWPGFEVHLNDCLQGLGFGVIAGFVIKRK